jgi:TRAP transporter TAXI family solute receptor
MNPASRIGVRAPVRTRRCRTAGVFTAALLLHTVSWGCGDAGGGRFVSIGTGGTGGLYYVLGGAIARQLTAVDSTRQYTAQVTGGSVENVNRIREGQLDLGIAMAITARDAYAGEGDYTAPVTDLRIVAPFYPNVTHVLVTRGSRARSIADLRGQRVSVGSPGSGTEAEARQLLEAAGLTYDDIRPFYLSFSESAAALQDASIDAAIISAGYPAGAVLEATTTGDARLIPVEDAVFQALREDYPFYERSEIPAGVYRGVAEPVPTIRTRNWIVAREDLPGDVVEHLLDIFAERRASLEQVHAMARQIDIADLEHAPIPLHPAAQAWLARRGGGGGVSRP